MEEGGLATIGLAPVDSRPTLSRRDIKFSVYLERIKRNGYGNMRIFEDDTDNGLITVAQYQLGDVIRIERVGTSINYLLNGEVVSTSPQESTVALRVEGHIYYNGMTVSAPVASTSFEEVDL